MALTTITCSLVGVVGDGKPTEEVVRSDEAEKTDGTEILVEQPMATPQALPTDTPSADSSGERNDPEIPVEQRMAALEEVNDFLNTLPGVDRDADNQEVAAYLASRPEFKASGVSPDGTVWAEFSDGREFFFFNNRPNTPGPAGAQADTQGQAYRSGASPYLHLASAVFPAFQVQPRRGESASPVLQGGTAELPKTNQVRMLNALGTYYGPPPQELKSWLAASGYDFVDGDATVDELKNVSGDGIFYFRTHGGRGRDVHSERVYGLWTSTPVNAFNDTLLKADLDAGRLRYAAAPHDENPMYDPDLDNPNSERCQNAEPPCQNPYRVGLHYSITPEFVEHYMSFGGNTLVFIDACSSQNNAMRRAFLGKTSVSTYAGWTGSVSEGFTNKTAKLFFDRLLGVNKEPPEEKPKVRPFDAESVHAYMVLKDAHSDPADRGTTFEVLTSGVGLTVLVPSIKVMEVHEDTDELFIYGIFGTEQGKVWIDGSPVKVLNWESDLVVVHLEDKGPGSAGDVIVEVRDHESNMVPLTEWRGQIHYQANADTMAPNLNTLVDMDVHLRADVHAFREKPWEPPQDREVHFTLAGDSKAHFNMNGSAEFEGAKFETTGSGSLPLVSDQPNHDKTHFEMVGVLQVEGLPQGKPPDIVDVNFHLHLTGDMSESKLTITAPGMPKQESPWPILQTDALFGQTLELDEKYNILEDRLESGTVQGMPAVGKANLSWDQLDAKHAPSLSDPPHAHVLMPSGGNLLALTYRIARQ
jgi:hypothetical protein